VSKCCGTAAQQHCSTFNIIKGEPMRHNKIKNLLGAYFDNELKDKTKKKIEKHLKVCSECAKELSRIKKLNKIAQEPVSFDLEESYWESFPNRIKIKITQQIKKSKWQESKEFFTKLLIIRSVYLKWAGALAVFIVIFLASIYYLEHQNTYKKMPELAKKTEKPQTEISEKSIKTEDSKDKTISFPTKAKKETLLKPSPLPQISRKIENTGIPAQSKKEKPISEIESLEVRKYISEGIVGGVTGGVVLEVEPPIQYIGKIKPPRLIKKVEPIYPKIAKKAKIEGVVILEVTIDIYGRVQHIKILRSIPLLDQAAIDAVKQWVFEPIVINGIPRKAIFTVNIRFQLKESKENKQP
jgi:protein TonB